MSEKERVVINEDGGSISTEDAFCVLVGMMSTLGLVEHGALGEALPEELQELVEAGLLSRIIELGGVLNDIRPGVLQAAADVGSDILEAAHKGERSEHSVAMEKTRQGMNSIPQLSKFTDVAINDLINGLGD